MARKNIRLRRRRRKLNSDFELQLTSMMDMLIILIVFLLKSYSTNAISYATSDKIQLPTSKSQEIPSDAVNVVIEPEAIIVDGERILTFTNTEYAIADLYLGNGGRKILPLSDSLQRAKEKALLTMSRAIIKDSNGKIVPPTFKGELVIHADKAIRYEMLRKVMYTAGNLEYKVFKFITLKKES